MANQRTTIITQEGINEIYNGVLGPYFALKYFLPVYDPRIDDVIHTEDQDTTTATGVEVQHLSATIDGSDTYSTLEGEKIFNQNSQYVRDAYGVSLATDVYSIASDASFVYTSATNVSNLGYGYSGNPTFDGSSISGSSQYIGVRANLINGTSAMSGLLSAATLSGDNNGNFSGSHVELSKFTEIPFQLEGGLNLSATSMLHQVSGYTKITSAGAGVDAGRYTLVLDSTKGNFRFNKFILFASRVDGNGDEVTTVLPVPFAEVAFEGTQTKRMTDPSGNSLLWEGIVQLVFTTETSASNLTNLVVSNWSDTNTSAFGLTTHERVYIYQAGSSPSVDTGSKLTVESSSGPQIALGTSGIFSTIRTNSAGTCIVSANNGTVHLLGTTSTGVGADSSFNDFVIENSTIFGTGLTILTANSSSSLAGVAFGSSKGNKRGRITYNTGLDEMKLYAGNVAFLESTSALTNIPYSLGVSGAVDVGGNVSIDGTVSINDKIITNVLIQGSTITGATASNLADHLVIEDGGDGPGMSLLTKLNAARIYFGTSADNDVGWIKYTFATTDEMAFRVDATTVFKLTSAGNTSEVDLIANTLLKADVIQSITGGSTISATDNMWVGQVGSTGMVAAVNADELVVESNNASTGAGITILNPSGGKGNIFFGIDSDNNAGRIIYTSVTNPDEMQLWVNATESLALTSASAILWPGSGGIGTAVNLLDGNSVSTLAIEGSVYAALQINTGSNVGKSYALFGRPSNTTVGRIVYQHNDSSISDYFDFYVEGTAQMRLTSAALSMSSVYLDMQNKHIEDIDYIEFFGDSPKISCETVEMGTLTEGITICATGISTAYRILDIRVMVDTSAVASYDQSHQNTLESVVSGGGDGYSLRAVDSSASSNWEVRLAIEAGRLPQDSGFYETAYALLWYDKT